MFSRIDTGHRHPFRLSSIQSQNIVTISQPLAAPTGFIIMQNRGHGFVLEQNHPHQVYGGKLVFHIIISAVATLSGTLKIAFGVMDGHHQPRVKYRC